MKIHMRHYEKIFCLWFAAIMSAYALVADFAVYVEDGLDVPKSRVVYYFLEQMRGSIVGKGGILTILTLALVCLYSKIDHYVSAIRYRRFFVGAMVLSAFTVIYYPYEISGTISLMYSTWFQVGKSLAFLFGYAFLIYYGILGLYQYTNKLNCGHNLNAGKREKYYKNLGILVILWLPHIIVKIPGAFTADTRSQIRQALGMEVYTGHHPIFMTWILKLCLRSGQHIFSSYRVGISFFFLMQVIFMILIFSYTIYFLEVHGVSPKYRNILWLIYALCPYIVGYIGVILKDVLYSVAFLWFIISCIHYLETDNFKICWKILLELTASGCLTILARKNGKEIVYPTLLVIGIVTIWKNKRQCQQMLKGILVVILPIFCAAVISKGLTQHYDIIPGSIGEALSMPFQQTARVARDHGDEISEEERKAIDTILQYDSLAERYTPMISNPVKRMYNDDATKKELYAYAKVWLKQLIKYPLTYIEATAHQNYQLLSLLANNQHFYFLSDVGSNLNEEKDLIEGYPLIEKIEARFVSFYGLCSDMPIIGLFCQSSFYCVLLVVLTIFVWCDKKYKMLIVLLPMWMTIGICVLGPVIDGNPRYTFPIVYSIPFVFGYYTLKEG